MENNFEHFIFQQELGRLYKEYKRCTDAMVRKEISRDIELLECAIRTI